VSQTLAQIPPPAQARHWFPSHVVTHTPAEHVWHPSGSQGEHVPLTHVSQEPHRVWQVPLTQSSQAPHRLRHAPSMQSWQALALQPEAWSSIVPSQSSSTPLQISGGSTAIGLRTL